MKKLSYIIFPLFRRILVFIIKLLPDKMLLSFKADLKMIRKMDYSPKEIFLSIDSKIEYDYRMRSCSKEPELIKWIQKYSDSTQVFYDIGANIGAYSLVAAKNFCSDSKIYAFEPSFKNFPKLCENIMINGSADSIVPLQVALSDKTSIQTLNYNSLDPGGAIHSLNNPIDDSGKAFSPVFKQPVLTYSLDHLVSEFDLPAPDLIKIDIDGLEYLVLKGAEHTLRHSGPNSIFIELNPGNSASQDILDFLSGAGYVLAEKHMINDHGGNDIADMSFNGIFVRKEDK